MTPATSERSRFFWPSRWPGIAGLILVVIGSLLPWQTMRYPDGLAVVTGGLDGYSAPGAQLILSGAIAVLLLTRRFFVENPTRLVQLAPAAVGLVTLVLAIQFYRDVAPTSLWDPGQTGAVVVEPGMWLALLGSLLIALSGGAVSVQALRSGRHRPSSPGGGGVDLRVLVTPVAAVVGIVGAFVLLDFLSSTSLGKEPSMAAIALVCLLGGPVLAVSIANLLVRLIRGERPGGAVAPPIERERVRRG